MTDAEAQVALNLATKLASLKAGTRWGKPKPKVRPSLLPIERDMIVAALISYAGDVNQGEQRG